LFTYHFKEGNPSTALNEPNTVVLSQDIANKLFGTQSAINKVIHIKSATNGDYDYKVTGVFIPSTIPSHIDAHFFMSMKGGDVGAWVSSLTDMVNNNMFFAYLLLKPGTDPGKLQSKFDSFIKEHAGNDLKGSGRSRRQYLTPVRDIHLYANDEGNVTPGGSLSYLYILLSIAIVTLLIACVNFMNLSTARSSKRALEIGVRKVLGASVPHIVLLLSKDFIKLIGIAFVIAAPVAWYVMHNWLQDFAYRTNISWWIFGAAGALATFIALATISFQAIKAALANPVRCLRTE